MRPVSLAVLWCSLAFAQDAETEEDVVARQQSVQDQLLLERAALATLKDEETSVLEVVDVIERRHRMTEERASRLDHELTSLKRRRRAVVRQEDLARRWVDEQTERLAPRLRAMYRLWRKGRADVLLSATDLSQLVWRARALSTLVEQDLAVLKDMRAALDFHEDTRRVLESVSVLLSQRSRQVAFERALSLKQQQLLDQILVRVTRDAKNRERLVRDLEAAERSLSKMVERFESGYENSRVLSRRRALPWPVKGGWVEVRFGKLVNPKFKTVTVHNGLDIRAPEGTPVCAISDGKVVYADWLRGYGNLLILDHGDGFHSLAAHLSDFNVAVGEAVTAGDEVGFVGDTGSMKGPFLYFELRKDGTPIDPSEWLGPAEL